ncbi:hypothetical protein AK830_g1667 [Neonectria ditissima]|uniref:Amine oxidase domain-containing protein n=1 Tax=Neonectria ditissima TaxID=78410 RepID=A0A0N8H8M0_9HYPO|nr:hypothetical protein AK830_g1667 [Neonectria ditissima]
MYLNLNSDLRIRDQWAQKHAVLATKEEWNRRVRRDIPGPEQSDLILDRDKLPPPPAPAASPDVPDGLRKSAPVKIGIVGAGSAGLFTGMVLDYLNAELAAKSSSLSFTYDIIEAAGPERVGGRLFSYNFGGPRDTHDYYDVGAMRFPDNPVMARTFDLFSKLKMNKVDFEKNPDAEDGSLIPYYMNNGGPDAMSPEPWSFNDTTIWGKSYVSVQDESHTDDPFSMATDGSISPEILRNSPDAIMSANIEPLRAALKKDLETNPPGDSGWKLLMEYDTYSTRQFLGTSHPEIELPLGIPKPPYNYDTIEWMETFNGGTDWYDQAHSETVLENLDFEYDAKTKWYCVLGGAQQLAKKMEGSVANKPAYNSRVTAMRTKGVMEVEIDIAKSDAPKTESKTYQGIFSTTTLGCLRRMDLRQAGLSYPVKQAIRSLGYGTSAKVAIKFKRAWWIHDLQSYNVKKAGLGHSDLCLRTCVYPSYNIYDAKSKTAVLLCSYTWQQDSQRLSSLISTNKDHAQKVRDEAGLKELLLRDLAILHKNKDVDEESLYKLISELYVDHHAYDWSEDPNTAGAFAFFRPQQFTSMWNKLIQPSGDIVFVGEAASPHHAWVVGALESVVHGLHSWMSLNKHLIPEFEVAMDMLKESKEGNPFVGLPPYMSERMSKWNGVLGGFTREEHLQGVSEEPEAAAAAVKASPTSLFDMLDLKALIAGE